MVKLRSSKRRLRPKEIESLSVKEKTLKNCVRAYRSGDVKDGIFESERNKTGTIFFVFLYCKLKIKNHICCEMTR